MSASAFSPRRGVPVRPLRPRTDRPAREPATRRFDAAALLGNEPPLDVEAKVVPSAGGRHALSFRWLGASVLTALAGTLLLGSAIVVSQRGEVDSVEAPETAPVAAARTADGAAALRKGDKLIRAETVASAKQSFRTPVTMRSGEREVIKIRSFTRLSTALSLTAGVFAPNIPPFNPIRLMAAQGSETDRLLDAPPPAEPTDAEVSIVKSDLSALLLDPAGPALSDADALLQALAEARAAERSSRPTALALPTPVYQPRAAGGAFGPGLIPGLGPTASDPAFRSIEVRVVPENVTTLPKAASTRAPDGAYEERTVAIKRNETLEGVLRAAGAKPDDARTIAITLGARDRALEGYQLRLLLSAGEPRAIMRAILFGERGIEAIAAMNDRRAYVSVTPPQTEAPRPEPRKAVSEDDEEDEDEGSGVQLYQSLYETAARHDIARPVVDELVRVLSYDVDFQRRVSAGDTLELVLGSDDEGSERQELLSATLTMGGEARRVFRYQGEDGQVDFFDEQGRSLKKFLLRKPILEAKLTSGFGVRIHPILGYAKGHSGVDWANRVGTPIFAAGNGTVISAEYSSSGYGRRIEIQHANGYVTTYNHQSAFARGMAPGVKVRQGQVIGYVGSTGLSTGPHLHYEVIVNGRFVDPMKIRVPRGRELDGRALAEFTRQRDQILLVNQRGGGSGKLAAAESR